jgi:hypothetical protein
MAIFDKNGGCVAVDHRPEARIPHPHMFPCYRSHFGFMVESISWSNIHRCYTSALLKMVVHAIFDRNGVVRPLSIDQRLVHLTPHMFSCHRSHSWIYGGDHFLVKNS